MSRILSRIDSFMNSIRVNARQEERECPDGIICTGKACKIIKKEFVKSGNKSFTGDLFYISGYPVLVIEDFTSAVEAIAKCIENGLEVIFITEGTTWPIK